MTPTTKLALDAAAEKSGRSLSQEAEFRLERSFDERDTLREAIGLIYGPNLGGLLKTIGDAMSSAGQAAQVSWFFKHRTDYRLEWTQIPELFDLITGIGRELMVAAAPPEGATENTFVHVDGIALRDFVTERIQEHYDADAGRPTRSALAPTYLSKIFSWKTLPVPGNGARG